MQTDPVYYKYTTKITILKLKHITGIYILHADSERGFSVLRKIHTDQRPSLKPSTISSLMAIKFNSEECCYDTPFSPELLSKCKKATVLSLNHK